MNRDISDLRNLLFEEIELLRIGKSTEEQASSVCQIARTLMDSARLEMDYHKLVSRLDEQGIDYQPHMGVMPMVVNKLPKLIE